MVRNIDRSYIVTMTSGYQALTEKEKLTLRLLIAGHDSKSMARHLGLSVHTVNERLRDARRKLGTSSSREAARLLHEMEAQTPHLLGDKSLGDASRLGALQWAEQPARGGGGGRRAGWIVGGIIMTIAIALLALSALSGPGQSPAAPIPATAQVSSTPASEAAAIDAARQFLALLDRDDWTASWQSAHKSFQLLNTMEWWAENSRRVRSEIGTIRSRELATVDFVKAPPDGYWQISFRASYSNNDSVVETVSLASEDGQWKMAGITVE